MTPKPELPILPFASADAWDAWLDEHAATSDGIRLKLAKKGNPAGSVTMSDAVDVALCHGWIDGQSGRFDDQWWTVRFTPRRPRSIWSQVNVERVARLTAEGRMRPAGLAEVERARADGRWEAAYAPPSTITVPDDLAQALDAVPRALATFDALKSQERYVILHRIYTAKRPETRTRRIATFVAQLAAGEPIR